MTMRVIDLGINKELFDKIYDLIVVTMQHSDRFWYEVPFTKQNIITILWLANMWNDRGYHAWIDGEVIMVEKWKEKA